MLISGIFTLTVANQITIHSMPFFPLYFSHVSFIFVGELIFENQEANFTWFNFSS